MYMSSLRKAPNPPRPSQSRGVPTGTFGGTSLSRPRPQQGYEIRAVPLSGISGSNISQRQPSSQSTRPISGTQDNAQSRGPQVPTKKQSYDQEDSVVIHVCDENRKINKDFTCEKNLLLSHMKYFEQYLLTNPLEEIDISVHCDVQIFEWLMEYMLGESAPKLDTTHVISILISSDFLQMELLVAECVKFVKTNLEDVIKLPIDMNCLNDKLLRQVANLFKDAELDEVKDRKDKLAGKLFVAKLKMMLEDENKVLNKCVYCSKLFTNAQREWMVCEKAKIFIDFHGKVIAEHVPDRSWDINKFIMFLETQGLTWREIYWKVWGSLISFQCLSCGEHFVGNEMKHCSYHPLEPKFNVGSNIGNYQCCNQQAVRFDTSIKKKGCAASSHQIKPEHTYTEEYEILMNKFEVIEEPFNPSADDKRSLISMIKLFLNDREEQLDSEDDPDEIDQEEEELTDSDEEKDNLKKKNRKIKKIQAKKSEINPVKQRVWKLDQLRMEDFLAMKDLGQRLAKLRKKPEKIVKPAAIRSKK